MDMNELKNVSLEEIEELITKYQEAERLNTNNRELEAQLEELKQQRMALEEQIMEKGEQSHGLK